MSVRRPARLAGLVTGVALAATLLGGCGAAQPGVAATVGDETITVDQVDDLAADVCTLQAALPQEGAQQSQTTTGLAARDGALQSMVLRSMADQMAADFGFSAGEEYQSQVDRLRLQFGGIDEDKVDAALPAYAAIPYFVDIMRQIGKTTGADNDDDALTAGIKEAQSWQSENGVETNPMFGSFNIGDQEIESERDDLAFPASQTAKDAGDGSADYIASLPESQRCG